MVHRVTTCGATSDNEWQRVVQRVTTNDSEWHNEWQRMTTSGTTNDEWQRMTTSANEWQREAISANFSIFQIREEPTTKHPKENSKHWRGPLKKAYWIKSRNKLLRRNTNSKKEAWHKQLFADFHENKCS